jgi:predicted amidohydrolase
MEALCRAASEQNCELIAFPAYNWLDALGSYPFSRKYDEQPSAARVDADTLDVEDEEALAAFFPETSARRLPFAAYTALRLSAGSLMRLARRTARDLARRYNIVVHAGTTIERHKKRLYNTAVIAFPGGEVITQRALHPTRAETSLGILPGQELSAFAVGGAMCCAPVGLDAAYYEPFAAARRVGCDVAIAPILSDGSYHAPAAKRGAWARAIENCLYVVKPALTGVLLGKLHTGYAGIYGPDGSLVRSQNPVGDELVTATLDFEALRRFQALRPAPNAALEAALRRLLATGHIAGSLDEGKRR